MAIFVIIGIADYPGHQNLPGAIERMFPNANLPIGHRQWLVSCPARTAKEVSDSLGITSKAVGTGYVFEMASYYGNAPTSTWDWIKARMEGAPSG